MALPQVNVSKYKTVIPSLGKEVEYRPYLVKEEKILMIAMESQDQQQILTAVKDVISNCIYDDVKVSELAIFDIEALFLALRGKSVGEGIDLKMKCHECEHMNDIELNINDINIPEVDNEDITIALNDEIGIVMRYPSFEQINSFKEGELETVDGVFKLLKSCIKSIYDEEDVYDADKETDKSLNNFIESLSSGQFQKVSDFFNDMPSLRYNVEYKCVKCENENTTELRGLQSFFT
jgi:hypothetical protein